MHICILLYMGCLKSFSSDESSPPPLPKWPVGKGSRGIEGVAIANLFLHEI